MNLSRGEIIRTALTFGGSDYDKYTFDIDELQEFVNAICAVEREACAKVCDRGAEAMPGKPHRAGAARCAAAIRARGNGAKHEQD